MYLFVFVIVLLHLALNLCHGLRNLVKAITDRHIARLRAYACVCSRGIEVFWQWMTNGPAFIFPSVPIAKCINSDSSSSSSEGHRVHHRFLSTPRVERSAACKSDNMRQFLRSVVVMRPLCQGYQTKAKGSLHSGKAPG